MDRGSIIGGRSFARFGDVSRSNVGSEGSLSGELILSKAQIMLIQEPIAYVDEMGQFHREDGPAIEYPNGTKYWFCHGKRHRVGGPAVEYHYGDKSWYQNGLLHREDGPAKVWKNKNYEWFYKGTKIAVDNLKDFQSFINNKAFW